MGLAVYNSIILDIRFPPCCYKKLLSPAVVPFHDPQATVGIAPLGLQDLMETMPVRFQSIIDVAVHTLLKNWHRDWMENNVAVLEEVFFLVTLVMIIQFL